MFSTLKKIFGTKQSRLLNRYRHIVVKINEIESQLQALSEEELQKKTIEFRERLAKGENTENLLPEAYAVVKNACRRLIGTDIHVSGYNQKWDMVPYDVQLLGAIAMYYGAVAEMQTGEGKTVTAAMPLYLHALTGKPVHLVTVNDYLAKRDCEWIGEIFRYLQLSTNVLTNDTPPEKRKEIYAADIVYGTASEFGFDYLRDNSMAQHPAEQVQRGHYFAIIDEVDSILIDEARTPLIISGPSANPSKQLYKELQNPVAQIVQIQKKECEKIALEVQKTLQAHNITFDSNEEIKKRSKSEQKVISDAMKTLWLVSKGNPQNKILQRIKEHPDLRALLEEWETHFYADPNKEDRLKTLSELHIIIDEKANDFELTDKGMLKWFEITGKGNHSDFTMLDLGYEYSLIDSDSELSDEERLQKKTALREEDSERKERIHNIRQLLRAHLLMEKDVDYIVQDNKIIIIDENTGRPQPGRRFSDGLHQAIEAKESVTIQQETQTYATITLQNYFRLYDRLAGMTGTAMTEAQEFKEIYKLEVIAIPTYKPCCRTDADDEIYMTEREKYNAILQEVLRIHGQGRPILLGTESVESSEKLSRLLNQNNLKHLVLNAKHHTQEAEIIAHAGEKGAIIVATNMAGRGTDIKLSPGVADLGGLHVIGTTRHQSRRIDRQLRGRCARQGDPGSSKFYVSFEDSLLRIFASPRLTGFLQRFRPPEGEPISAKILNKSIETAQERVEQRNYSIRKHTLQYDDVMNKQRTEVYAFRNEILGTSNSVQIACEVLEGVVAQISSDFFPPETKTKLPINAFRNHLMMQFPVTFTDSTFKADSSIETIEKTAYQHILSAFHHKLNHEARVIAAIQSSNKQAINPLPVITEILHNIILRTIDSQWQNHLLIIDYLRAEVNLRSLGQKDPLLEFKEEAFAHFEQFSKSLRLAISHALFKFSMIPPRQARLNIASYKELEQITATALFPEEYELPAAHNETLNSNVEIVN